MTTTQRTLAILAFACVAPFVASFALYFLWTPGGGQVNYGTLLPPRELPLKTLRDTVAMQPGTADQTLRGKWLLLIVDRAECTERCQAKLYAMRQSRTMTGKERDRIERVWLVSDDGTPSAQLLAEHPGLLVVAPADRSLLESLPADAAEAIYIVDPRDNLILRYPANPDIRGLFKDLSRLLLASRIG